jgi:hypothetical protein
VKRLQEQLGQQEHRVDNLKSRAQEEQANLRAWQAKVHPGMRKEALRLSHLYVAVNLAAVRRARAAASGALFSVLSACAGG